MDLLILLLIGGLNFIVVSLFTLSGGIGLVMRPIMMFLGVPPDITVGTSRLSSLPGNILAQTILHKSKSIDWKLVLILAPAHICGGLLGIFVLTSLETTLIKKIMGVLLLFGGALLVFKKKVVLSKRKKTFKKISLFFSIPIMFVVGTLLMLVGGVGSISRLLFILGYGKTHIEAAAIQKAINFWQTIITSGIFIYMLLIDWLLFLVLAISSFLGNYVGTKFILKKGNTYLHYLLLGVIVVSAIKLIFFT